MSDYVLAITGGPSGAARLGTGDGTTHTPVLYQNYTPRHPIEEETPRFGDVSVFELSLIHI